MKKTILIILASAIAAAAVLVWIVLLPPAFIQRRLIDYAAAELSKKLPLKLEIKNASGSLFGGIKLTGLKASLPGKEPDFFTADSCEINLSLRNLAKKKAVISSLSINKPVLRIIAEKNGSYNISSLLITKGKSKTPLTINRLIINDGTVFFENAAVSRPYTLSAGNFNLRARLGREITIDKADFSFSSGTVSGSGEYKPEENKFYSFNINTEAVNLSRIPGIFSSGLSRRELPLSAVILITGHGARLRADANGTLAGSPISFNYSIAGKNIFTAALGLKNIKPELFSGKLKLWGKNSLILKGNGTLKKLNEINLTGSAWAARETAHSGQKPQTVRAELSLTAGQGLLNLFYLADGLSANGSAKIILGSPTLIAKGRAVIDQAEALTQIIPGLSLTGGPITAQAVFSGTYSNPVLKAVINGKELIFNKFKKSPWDLTEYNLKISGIPEKYRASFEGRLQRGTSIQLDADITSDQNSWLARLNTLTILTPKYDTLTLSAPAQLRAQKKGGLQADNLRFTTSGGSLTIQEAWFNAGRLALKADVKNIEPQILLEPAGVNYRLEGGKLNATLSLTGTLLEPRGHFSGTLSQAKAGEFSFKSLSADLELDNSLVHIRSSALIPLITTCPITATGAFPWHAINPNARKLPFDVGIRADTLDPRTLSVFFPDILFSPGGQLQAAGKVSGYMPDIKVTGNISFTLPRVRIDRFGVNLTDVKGALIASGNKIQIEELTGKMGKGKCSLSGKAEFPLLMLQFKGRKVSIEIPRKFEALANTDLTINGSLNAPKVSGIIKLLDWSYTKNEKTLDKLKKAQPEQLKPPSKIWLATEFELYFKWPKGGWYREGLTKIETVGDLKLTKDPGQDLPRLVGLVSLVRGSYDTYGKEFTLNSGDIDFNGEPDLNPRINAQASFQTKDTLVRLDITGTRLNPKLNLTSTPPMTQPEIMSVIMTGKSTYNFSPGSGQNTNSATQAQELAGGIISDAVTRQLRNSALDILKLDMVRVTPTASGTTWTVGRYISRDLFVSYSHDTQQSAATKINAEYYLSPNWSFQAQTSTREDDFIDILFRHPLKRKKQ